MLASPTPDLQTTVQPSEPLTPLDPLAYLPCTPIREYGEGQTIYTDSQPCARIYLIIQGKVKISRRTSGLEVVLDIYRADEFFGESALAEPEQRMETAMAIEGARVMSWSREQIEETVESRPKLAVALLQLIARRSVEFGNRIESFSSESIEPRLKRTLIRFAGKFGERDEDGTVRMDAFTHELLSQYVGTSREIVTHHMSQFRRDGFLTYSRAGIILHARAMTEWQAMVQKAAA
jgi:CRP/FNR family cyclic AMP-dependent transcriptional regulator